MLVCGSGSEKAGWKDVLHTVIASRYTATHTCSFPDQSKENASQGSSEASCPHIFATKTDPSDLKYRRSSSPVYGVGLGVAGGKDMSCRAPEHGQWTTYVGESISVQSEGPLGRTLDPKRYTLPQRKLEGAR